MISEKGETVEDKSLSELVNLCASQSQQIANLQEEISNANQDLYNAKETVKYFQSKLNSLEEKRETRSSTFIGWNVVTVLIFSFVAFCIGSCINGCAAEEDHFITNNEIVHSIEPYSISKVKYTLKNNPHVILLDKSGKYNIGDTIKILK